MEISEIAKIISKNGGKLYLVGGCLRDKILNRANHDEDYCVTGIKGEEFLKLFPNAHVRGKSFEVYDIDGKEFAMARKEKKIAAGHKGFEIQTGKITIEDDLLRRDITINSLAQNVITGEVIDVCCGMDDLKNGIIRATSEAFKEDPLRVYRVARLAALLDFQVEPNTIQKMKMLKSELTKLTKERIFIELKKALCTQKPSKFFNVLKEAEVLDVHFNEIYQLIGAQQPADKHPEGDAYEHTMLALENSVKLTNNPEIRFSVLVHDLGKGVTPKEMYPHHYGHDEKGVSIVEDFCYKIGTPKSWMKCGKDASKWHMKGGIFETMTPKKQLEFIENVNSSLLGLEGMKIVVECDKNRPGMYKKTDFDKIGKECLDKVNGKFIYKKYNITEGELFGEKLHQERIQWLRENNLKGEKNERDER